MIKRLSLVLLLQIFLVSAYAGMPGWLIYRDADGNKYFVDDAGKIQTSEEPDERYKAVSSEGIYFYMTHAEKLIQNHYKIEGLRLLKSIRNLGMLQEQNYQSSVLATKKISELRKREGDRFHELSLKAEPSIFRIKENYYLNNTEFGYKFKSSGNIDVLSKKTIMHYNYIRDSITIAIKKSLDSEGYDLIIVITAEKFHYKFKNVDDYNINVLKKLPPDTFKRDISKRNRFIIQNNFSTQDGKYSGQELYKVSGLYGYYVRVYYPTQSDESIIVETKSILNQFESGKY